MWVCQTATVISLAAKPEPSIVGTLVSDPAWRATAIPGARTSYSLQSRTPPFAMAMANDGFPRDTASSGSTRTDNISPPGIPEGFQASLVSPDPRPNIARETPAFHRLPSVHEFSSSDI